MPVSTLRTHQIFKKMHNCLECAITQMSRRTHFIMHNNLIIKRWLWCVWVSGYMSCVWPNSFFNPTPEQKSRFWHLLVIQITRKNLTFPKYLWQCLPYSFGVSKWPKNGFLYHFCRWRDENSDPKMRFFGLVCKNGKC